MKPQENGTNIIAVEYSDLTDRLYLIETYMNILTFSEHLRTVRLGRYKEFTRGRMLSYERHTFDSLVKNYSRLYDVLLKRGTICLCRE